MFKKIAVAVVVLLAVCALTGIAMAQDKTTTTTTTTAVAAATPAVTTPEMVGNKVCPVSGATIAAADLGKNTVEYKGKVYNLCSAGCKDEFMKDPEKYVAKVNEEMAAEKK